MASLGCTEARDLEGWLASTGSELFDREILWIARQDRPSTDQRSDLVGLDDLGNVLIVELKRGVLEADAVTQGLAYAAEYAELGFEGLVSLFAEQSQKNTRCGLLVQAASIDDARHRIAAHAGEEAEYNEAQVIVLVAEDFDAKALAIAQYLNESAGDATFSIECWRYSVFQRQSEHFFVMEQVLPPPNIREQIEEKREAAKGHKYARDPERVAFMKQLIAYLENVPGAVVRRSRGASYACKIKPDWLGTVEIAFSMKEEVASLHLPSNAKLVGDPAKGITAEESATGTKVLFKDTSSRGSTFSPQFGDRLVAVLRQLTVAR